jgi:hypothetical protein
LIILLKIKIDFILLLNLLFVIGYLMNRNNKQSIIHTKMYETLYKTLMTPHMIKIRKENMKKRLILYELNKSRLIQQIKVEEMDFVEYLKELEKENMKYCQEKII